MIISPPIRDGSATPEKTKWELVIRDKNFLDLNTWLSLVDTRFVLLFLEFTKKILASVYERSWKFDSSLWKTAFKNIGC